MPARLKPVAPVYVRRDKRGAFVEILRGRSWKTVIVGSMKRGAVMGHHYHRKTRIFFHVVRGAAEVTLVDVRSGRRLEAVLSTGEGVYLEPGWSHRIHFRRVTDFLLLKSRAYRETDPDMFPCRVD